jgi:hypothetical protein
MLHFFSNSSIFSKWPMLSPVSGEPFGAVGALGKLGAFGVLKLKVGGVGGGVGGSAHSQVVHVAFVIMFIELVVTNTIFFHIYRGYIIWTQSFF